MMTASQVRVSTRTVHTITVHLPDEIVNVMRDADQVELQLQSNAIGNRMPAVIRLPWSTIKRLSVDNADI